MERFGADKRKWSIPADRTKNGVAYQVPITGMMAKVLAKVPGIVDQQMLFTTNGHVPIGT